ncbi:glutathione S-transferase 1-like [Ochlerotatus camptorhynchus]|uniref:glutathione S-transferase 1-like n=1 Tax=Ochlerotatus camptorhynchus TaxID=644619 RepID=UPI0031D45267
MNLYYIPISPPCWTVQLLSLQLGITLNLKEIDYDAGEHLKEDFLKINPAHAVPTLVDGDDYSLPESRAIMVYLMELKAANICGEHPLYPKDAKMRGLIHSRLDFDLGMLYSRFYTYCSPLWDSESLDRTEKNREKVQEALGILEAFLTKTRYVAADYLTIADISVFVSVTSLDFCSFDRVKYVKVAAWYDTCKKELVGYKDVIEKISPVFKEFLAQSQQN